MSEEHVPLPLLTNIDGTWIFMPCQPQQLYQGETTNTEW